MAVSYIRLLSERKKKQMQFYQSTEKSHSVGNGLTGKKYFEKFH